MGNTAEHQALSYIELDDSRWPLLIVRPPRVVTDEQMESFLERHRALEAERAQDYALILDLRFCSKITSAQREMLTDGMETEGDDSWCRCLAMVFESRILRGILSMIFWARKPPYPTKVFATPELAEPWAKVELLRSRPHVPNADLSSANGPVVDYGPDDYFLQGDASFGHAKAEAFAEAARSLGYDTKIREAPRDGRVLFIPLLGPIEDADKAMDAARELDKLGHTARLVKASDLVA